MNNTDKKHQKNQIPPFLKNSRVLPTINNEEKKAEELQDILNDAAAKRGDMVETKG